MAWNTPKTDWTVPDIVTTTDMNEIGENLTELHNGSGSFYPVSIVSAANLPILDTHRAYYITGSTNISYIYVGNREAGAIITLVFDISAGISLVAGGISPPANYGSITSAGNITLTQWDSISLILINPTEWVPIHIS